MERSMCHDKIPLSRIEDGQPVKLEEIGTLDHFAGCGIAYRSLMLLTATELGAAVRMWPGQP
jgi:hypothetical protein